VNPMGVDPKRVVGALLVRQGDVLLGLRASHKTFPNCWDMFGGHIEAGETEVDTLVRELGEELGINPTQFQKVQHLVLGHNQQCMDLAIYVVTEWGGGEPVMLGDEHSEIRWFCITEVSRLTNLTTNEIKIIIQALE
jgi:8-oxo-dGTP diphosphatase